MFPIDNYHYLRFLPLHNLEATTQCCHSEGLSGYALGSLVRWCLYLRHLSSGGYELLRSSGILTLPSQRTLRDYIYTTLQQHQDFLVSLYLQAIHYNLFYIIRESVDSLCRDETDAPHVIHFKSVQTFKRLDSKAFWIAYCVSGVHKVSQRR